MSTTRVDVHLGRHVLFFKIEIEVHSSDNVRPVIIGAMGEYQRTMPTVVRVGLLGLALAFAAGAVDAAAQGMGSGPIQTLPWAAKQRSKPNKEAQKGAEADVQPTDQLRAEPIVGNGPVETQPKN